ncbi:dipicolinate synthase subunit DpsA [Clostridiaceae bacterium OttesenSCG-928-D20]|nr:dipicolinate synthase subunit DpsA [Clostridiaceae bacterium OttesenSCG-928-D20]
MKFSVIGGDRRIAKLSESLARDGHIVKSFALEKAGDIPGVSAEDTVKDCLDGADCVVLPLPLSDKWAILTSPLSEGEYPVDEIFSEISPTSVVCAGMANETCHGLAKAHGIEIIDYYEREELVIKNAIVTAEAAIEILIRETARTIWQSKILVLGNGRVGKVLAGRLLLLGADVSVSARRHEDFALIEGMGCKSLDSNFLGENLSEFDMIINTVPAMILTPERLTHIRKDALILDLASKPGGCDFESASNLGLNVVWSLGLPGKSAPITAGDIIKETIYNILEEQSNG